MEDKKICQDLEEDEELASLRLAALATLKKRDSQKPEPDTATVNNILPINSIMRIPDHSSEHGSRKNQNSWRSNAQPSKRKGKMFPKSSQRSNLIVITPVGADSKNASNEKHSAPQLLLPQHKWCHRGNEDSSSPKTDRRTGPTRFNRHGSESESSDSDYDDSDDSYSNETVLQDEPSRLSPGQSNTDDTELKNGISSERRLSFQNLESNLNLDSTDKNKITDVYSCTKDSYSQSADSDASQKNTELVLSSVSQNTTCPNNDSSHECEKDRHSPRHGDSYKIFENGEINSSTSVVNVSKQRSKHTPIKFDVPNCSGWERRKNVPICDVKEKPQDIPHALKDIRNDLDAERKSSESSEHKINSLAKNDLRFELKRKKANSERPVLSNRQNKFADTKPCSPNKDRVRNRFRSWSRDRSASQERKTYKRSRSRSPEHKRGRFNRDRLSSSQSSRSSSSSSSSSSLTSSDSSPRRNRSISSVVQPVQSKVVVTDTQNTMKSSINRKPYLSSSENDHFSPKKAKGIEIKLKPMSNIKISLAGSDQRNNASEVKKRGPVHMRLGTLPRKRIIQMPKDVEAAFISTSSDDDNDVNNKCKKSNILVVTEMYGKKMEGVSRHAEKKTLQRSDVPKAGRDKVLR